MTGVLNFTVGALQILILNLLLSGDNVGVIALATRNLPKEYAAKASAIGISAAVGLRIFFTLIVVYIISIQWLPIKLVGGLLLIKITWDFINTQDEQEDADVKQSNKLWGAVVSIVLADITMSLDNVLAIASAAKGNMGLILFGLILSIPILFFGSKIVVELMKKYLIVVYIGGGILAHTAFNMILEDSFVVPYTSHMITVILPIIMGIAVVIYGMFIIKKENTNQQLIIGDN